jgi:hypothetical protein
MSMTPLGCSPAGVREGVEEREATSPVELDGAQRAQRDAQQAPPGSTAKQAQADAAELTAAVGDVEAERSPAIGIIGERELVERGRPRGRSCAHRAVRWLIRRACSDRRRRRAARR